MYDFDIPRRISPSNQPLITYLERVGWEGESVKHEKHPGLSVIGTLHLPDAA